MIERAFLAAGIGSAIYIENGQYFMVGAESEPVECRPGDVAFMEDSGAEITETAGPLDLGALRDALTSGKRRQNALTLSLGGLDPDLSAETRRLFCEAALEALKEEAVYNFVRNRLLSRPLPKEADLLGAIEISRRARAGDLCALYSEIEAAQDRVRLVADAWLQVGQQEFGLKTDFANAERAIIDSGVIAEFVSALEAGDAGELRGVAMDYAGNPALANRLATGSLLQALAEAIESGARCTWGPGAGPALLPNLKSACATSLAISSGSATRTAPGTRLVASVLTTSRELRTRATWIVTEANRLRHTALLIAYISFRRGIERHLFVIPRGIKEWLVPVIAIAGLTTALAATLSVLAKGGLAIATALVIAVLATLVVSCLVYICLKKTSPIESGLVTTPFPVKPVAHYAYSKQVRAIALACLVALPVLGLGGFAVYGYGKTPSKTLIIVVTTFEGPEPEKYRVTEDILERLRESTRQHPEVKIELAAAAITSQVGGEGARLLGKEKKAGIVLWGSYIVPLGSYAEARQGVETSVHFEMLNAPKGLTLENDRQIAIASVSEPASFNLRIQFSSEMSYLGLLTTGLALFERGDYGGALRPLSEALAQSGGIEDPAGSDICYRYRGIGYAYLGDYRRAIADYDKAIGLRPNGVDDYNNRGIAYDHEGDYDRAIADYGKALSLSRGFAPNAYNNRGNAYQRRGDHDKAIADFDSAIGLKPDDADAYYNRGNSYLDEGDRDKAIEDFGKAIALDPGQAFAYRNRGIAYSRKGDYDKAIDDFDREISLIPDDVYGYSNRAFAYSKKRNYDKAIVDFDRVMSLKPDDSDAFYSRGVAYYDEAKADFDKAKADPDKALFTPRSPKLP
jgi:tetratricopeptide (TPR) repeat protein